MNLLFIGDLRNCYNYGAIATTESLIRMVEKIDSNAELKFIDFRSLQDATPPNGWDNDEVTPTTYPNNKQTIKARIKNKLKYWNYSLRQYVKYIVPFGIVMTLNNRKQKKILPNTISYAPDMKYHIPYLFKDYDKWSKDMMEGRVLQYERKMLEWADKIIVNGEGNLVHGVDENGVYRHRACYILFIMWMAKVKFNLPVYIVNHCVDPNNEDAVEIIQKVYPLLDKIIVRDPLSLEKLFSYGINNAEYAPDALFSYTGYEEWEPSSEIKQQIDFSKPYILLGDSSGIQNAYNKVPWNVPYFFESLIEKLQTLVPQVIFVDGYGEGCSDINEVITKTGIGRVSLKNSSYQDLYEIMKRGEIFISGRWHASILSLLAGTPILLFGSDSHKTKSLYSVINYPYKFFETSSLPIHVDEIKEEAYHILKNKQIVSKDIREKCVLLGKLSYTNVECLREDKEKESSSYNVL